MSLSKKMRKALNEVAKIAAKEWDNEVRDIVEPEEYKSIEQFIIDDWINEGYGMLDNINEYLDIAVRNRLGKKAK